ncbi:MAG: dienelactone hydrolase family protein [Actinomycetota bacterium]
MIEAEVPIETADGTMSAFTTRPDEGGPFPVVFFYMDAPGKREELHDMARRIATTGYYVVLPNLYYRSTDEFVLDFETGANRDEMFDLMFKLSNRMIVSDTQGMIDFVDGEAAADGTRIGCVGYCMSGPFSLSVAAAYPDRVKAAASVYGVRLAVDADDSPHHGFPDTTGEIYVAAAETDEYAPPEMIAAVEQAIDSSGVNGRVEWYPGTHHGFAFPTRGGIFDKPAAERHWSRLHSLFARNLG